MGGSFGRVAEAVAESRKAIGAAPSQNNNLQSSVGSGTSVRSKYDSVWICWADQ